MVIVSVIVIVSLGILRRGVYISSLAWAGLTLLILLLRQCEGLIVGISTDGTYSHVFFVSINFSVSDDQQGSVGQHIYCVPKRT